MVTSFVRSLTNALHRTHIITYYMKLTKIPHARQGTRGGGHGNFPEIDTLFVINQVFLNVLH